MTQPHPPPPPSKPTVPPAPRPSLLDGPGVAPPHGLDAEQEIRARALEACSRMRWDHPFADTADACDVAEQLAAWIRDGTRPAEPEREPEPPCNCTQVPGSPNVWDGTECPQHNPAVRERSRS